MDKKFILTLDQGTTSSRAIVFDHNGKIIGMSQREFAQIYPQSGWVEHDPTEILSSQLNVIPEALVRAGITLDNVCAIGITNQRETTVVWDKKSGKPIYNAIVWQCRRTSEYCQSLIDNGYSEMVYAKTGLKIDAYFSASKIKWILDHVAGARARAENGELAFGTIDTYLAWHLSGGKIFATDYTNASRTMLFNIHALKWDEQLLDLFDVPRAMLPDVYPSSHLYGNTDPAVLGARIPICGIAGDQQSALFGQLCVTEGSAKNTYGTGCFLLMNTGKNAVRSSHGLLTTLVATADGSVQYALEGSVFVGGAVVQWLRDELKLISSAAETESIAKSLQDTDGVYVVPAFVGLGAPHWNSDARGNISGITRGTRREHIVRAALESIAYQVADVVDAMQKDCGREMDIIRVDGGASANAFLMQFQADILCKPLARPKVLETTALGVCYLAGLAVGYWKDLVDLKIHQALSDKFLPKMDENERVCKLKGWKNAVNRTL